MEMEEITGGGNNSETEIQWWWGVAAAAQMGLGMRSFAKGYAGDSRFMPLKAFTVASLFVGSAASTSVLLLQANGINGVLLSLSFHFLFSDYLALCFMFVLSLGITTLFWAEG